LERGRDEFSLLKTSVKDKCRKSVGSSHGESKVRLGEVNVFRELERRDWSVCQKSREVVISM